MIFLILQVHSQLISVDLDITSIPEFLRRSDNSFECLICPARKGKTRIMKSNHARDHALSGVHQRFLKTALQGTLRTPSLDVMGEMWQPRSANLVRIGSFHIS